MRAPSKIIFGTDGWRAIIAKDYTITNVRRVAEGTAAYMKENNYKKVVIGFDCRFGGSMFSMAAAEVFTAMGIEVLHDPNFVSTPMVSYGVVKEKADLGVVITASHNPPSYNGFKLKSKYGGPSIPAEVSAVEDLIPDESGIENGNLIPNSKLMKEINLEDLYYDHVVNNFDIAAIQNSGSLIAYDAMYGAGQDIFKRILPSSMLLHAEFNPSFKGQAPEPIHKNLTLLSQLVKSVENCSCGLATDGDADRIGMYDENGEFVDSHNLLLLLLYYLAEVKGQTGKVVVTFSVTDRMQKLAESFGLDFEVTKIGFKYIAEIMVNEDVLVGGEESGGLAIKGNIPERDGIWIGLTILEFMAKSGKKLSELVKMIHDKVGAFYFDRDDLHLSEEKKQAVIALCKKGGIEKIGPYKVSKIETIDGFKYYFGDGEWVMIRPSGTEPVLRVYAQAQEKEETRKILDATHEFFQN